MEYLAQDGEALRWQDKGQSLWLGPWGRNGLRVQSNLSGAPMDLPQALLERGADRPQDVEIHIEEAAASLRSGSSSVKLFRRDA